MVSYLDGFRAAGWRKALVFGNSRADIEVYASRIRQRSPFGDALYVHYSNIAPPRRREIEEQFASAEVAIQRIFSLLKQSPTGSVRLNELSHLLENVMSLDDLSAIVGELQVRSYLKPGRPGEWKSGPELNELFDQQTSPTYELSIYSNIQNSEGNNWTYAISIRRRLSRGSMLTGSAGQG